MNEASSRPRGKISIAGNIGSGKSSVARRVVEITGWPLVSTGSLFRDLAARRGLTVLELNQLAESDPTIDAEVDGNLISLAATDQAAVIDSRLAWHFVPESFKVYLIVDPEAAVGRVYGAGRVDERYTSLEEATAEVLARQAVEAERYHDTYGVDVDDWRNYDLIVDTSRAGIDTVAEVVLAYFDERSGAATPICQFDPARLMASPASVTAGDLTVDSIVRVAVHDHQMAIVSGHELVTAALDRDDRLIECSLAAFEDEEIEPGLSAIDFVSTIAAERRG